MSGIIQAAPSETYLGIAKVEERYDVDRTTVWRWCRAGTFPRPLYLSGLRRWRLSDLEAWERDRLETASNGKRGAGLASTSLRAPQ